MEGATDIIAAPVVQYGFAGFCVVLLAIIVWLISRVLNSYNSVTEAHTKVAESINGNTSIIATTHEQMKKQEKSISDFQKELMRRPCIAKGQAADFMKQINGSQ